MVIVNALFMAALHLTAVIAIPTPGGGGRAVSPPPSPPAVADCTTMAAPAAATGVGDAAPPAVEVLMNGTFGGATGLRPNAKNNVLYPTGPHGAFEVEFQGSAPAVVVVTTKSNPVAPPPGFIFMDPVSYVVSLGPNVTGATLQKIDFFFDPTASFVSQVDVAQGRIGKLSAEGTFIVDNTIGELEFEAEEREYTLTVNDLNGEWGIFIPATAVTLKREEGKEAKVEVVLQSDFGKGTPVSGGDFKNDIAFPTSDVGLFELEYNASTPNVLSVTQNKNPAAAPPGFKFVDPTSFVVKMASPVQNATLQKIDYIFSAATAAAINVSAGVIGKFDAASMSFKVDGLGEFEFEADENEWTLTVQDLNGEWATFIPDAAAAPAALPDAVVHISSV